MDMTAIAVRKYMRAGGPRPQQRPPAEAPFISMTLQLNPDPGSQIVGR
jgi:hypothetical protein